MRAGWRCPVARFGLGAEGLVKRQIPPFPSSNDAQTPPTAIPVPVHAINPCVLKLLTGEDVTCVPQTSSLDGETLKPRSF